MLCTKLEVFQNLYEPRWSYQIQNQYILFLMGQVGENLGRESSQWCKKDILGQWHSLPTRHNSKGQIRLSLLLDDFMLSIHSFHLSYLCIWMYTSMNLKKRYSKELEIILKNRSIYSEVCAVIFINYIYHFIACLVVRQ